MLRAKDYATDRFQGRRRRRKVQTKTIMDYNSQLRRRQLDLFGKFRIIASFILLASSAFTYFRIDSDHGREKSAYFSSERRNDIPTHASHPVVPLFVQGVNYENALDTYNIAQEIVSEHHWEKLFSDSNFAKIAADIREKFELLYGGQQAAKDIMRKGISTFLSDSRVRASLEYTARRMQKARENGNEFRLGFAGYSVTAGRGNYFNQSFPFVVERILQHPMNELGMKIKVINAGIGGVPSFPYGLCLQNFFGSDSLDVISWDFAMNEASDAVDGIEAFIRQVVSLQKISPMLLVKDTHLAVKRSAMIKKYVDAGALIDPIVLHTDPAADSFLQMEEALRPEGFQSWRDFGAPPNAPGKSKHHPAKREHEFIGWLISIHFLNALELLAASDLGLYDLREIPNSPPLPAPMQPNESSSIARILHGVNDNGLWTCRTSFEPSIQGDLREIIMSPIIDSLDMLLQKGLKEYNSNWVYDLGDAERKSKQQLQRFGGLGFIDSKKAFYGIYASGIISFFLKRNELQKDLSSVIVCESNDRREVGSCNMKEDITYNIGGVEVEVQAIDTTGFTYLGKTICIHMHIPPEAKLAFRDSTAVNVSTKRLENKVSGYALDISVRNPKIRRKEQACSISHIIWI